MKHHMERRKTEDLIDRAIEAAVNAHRKQKRKGTTIAYITHPFAVAVTLAKAGCSDEIIAAGILHDTVEDTPVKMEAIRKEFGDLVASIVDGCSEPDKRHSWKKRKQHTIDSLQEAGIEVKFVACADKLHNIRTIARDHRTLGERVWRRFRRGREDQRWYYTSLVESLRSRGENASYEKLYKEFKKKVKEVFDRPRKGRMRHGQRN